ncbi:MAG: trypsin, partial [Thermomicrobiales bacterium]|nr:trypsin [Thermomicrobiales bacterium]
GISAPVLADLKVDWGNALISDVSPDPLPDLFAGSQLVVLGRYTEGGAATITLTGTVDGERRTYAFPNQILPTARGDGWLPRLWATRRVCYLLNQIRLNGESRELVDEIVRLSVRFGIVTSYTSYLLTEDDILSAEGRTRVAQDVMTQAAQPAPVSGAAAVDRAVAMNSMASAESAAPIAATIARADGVAIDADEVLRYAGGHAFILHDGVWTDTTFDPGTMTPEQIAFLSDAYFDLLERRPELGPALALGEQVILVADGVTYEITAN